MLCAFKCHIILITKMNHFSLYFQEHFCLLPFNVIFLNDSSDVEGGVTYVGVTYRDHKTSLLKSPSCWNVWIYCLTQQKGLDMTKWTIWRWDFLSLSYWVLYDHREGCRSDRKGVLMMLCLSFEDSSHAGSLVVHSPNQGNKCSLLGSRKNTTRLTSGF